VARVKAAILAAGRGVRIGGDLPKSLIPVRGNESLLYYLLEGLKESGVEDLLVVTGFNAAAVQEYVGERWSGEAQYVFNARYASWGNLHSVRMALDQLPGHDVLILNSDIVVRPVVIQRVIGTPGDLVLAVERRLNLDDEDMRVRLKGNRVLAIGKDLKRAHGHGEFAGVSLIRPEAARAYLDVATGAEWQAGMDIYYEDVYARILDGLDTRATVVARGEYAEVDEWTDMEAAAAVIRDHEEEWPRSEAAV
jgi:L-glutamine-phosphate cytidylyltransferase